MLVMPILARAALQQEKKINITFFFIINFFLSNAVVAVIISIYF